MTDRFRMAYRHDLCPDPYTRPDPPHWLRPGRAIDHAEYNLRISCAYWTQMYWATPPWLTATHREALATIYRSATPEDHVDHIVPLRNALVCGLHVPWNLQILPAGANMSKSNKWWPDHPFKQLGLF